MMRAWLVAVGVLAMVGCDSGAGGDDRGVEPPVTDGAVDLDDAAADDAAAEDAAADDAGSAANDAAVGVDGGGADRGGPVGDVGLPGGDMGQPVGDVGVPVGDVGVGVDGGQDGGGAADGAVPLPPPTLDEVLRAGVLFGSCVPDDGVSRFIADVLYERRRADTFRGALRETVGCLAARDDACDGVEACTGMRVDLQGPCARGCEGDVYLACDDELRLQIDCTQLGFVCRDPRDCVPAGPPPMPCDLEDGSGVCLGDTPAVCRDGQFRLGVECGSYGLSCRDLGRGAAVCNGRDGACEPSSYGPYAFDYLQGVGCLDDSTLEVCIGEGAHHQDCGALGEGFRCFAPEDGPAYCGVGDACNPAVVEPARCEGDELVVCLAGQVARVDCTAVGFERCEAGQRWAACGPL